MSVFHLESLARKDVALTSDVVQSATRNRLLERLRIRESGVRSLHYLRLVNLYKYLNLPPKLLPSQIDVVTQHLSTYWRNRDEEGDQLELAFHELNRGHDKNSQFFVDQLCEWLRAYNDHIDRCLERGNLPIDVPINSFNLWRRVRLSTFSRLGMWELLFGSRAIVVCADDVVVNKCTKFSVLYTVRVMGIAAYMMSKVGPQHSSRTVTAYYEDIFFWSVQRRCLPAVSIASVFLPWTDLVARLTQLILDEHSSECDAQCPMYQSVLFVMCTRDLYAFPKKWYTSTVGISAYEYCLTIDLMCDGDRAALKRDGMLRTITNGPYSAVKHDAACTLLRYYVYNVKCALNNYFNFSFDE